MISSVERKQQNRRLSVLLAMGWAHHKFLQGASDYAVTHGIHLDVGMAMVTGGMPQHWRGDGVIAHADVKEKLQQLFPWVAEKMVFLSRPGLGGEQYHTISDDHLAISEMAAQYFIEKGYTDYATYRWARDAGPRTRMFSDAVESAGGSCKELVGEGTSWSERHPKLCSSLAKLRAGTALFCPNDQVALEVLEACHDMQISVPGELAVLGVRNDELVCKALQTPLSSVDNNLYGLGYEAVATLHCVILSKAGQTKHHSVQPTGVAERESTAIYKGELQSDALRKAIAVIRKSYQDPDLSCANLAKMTGVSLRKLYQIFDDSHHRKPAEEIRFIRMERAIVLLRQSADAVDELIGYCGYQNTRSFYKAFRMHTGMSPVQFRKQSKVKEIMK